MTAFLWLSEVQWSAISSIATTLGVIVALFLPFLLNWLKCSALKKSVAREMQENYKYLKRMNASFLPNNTNLPNGQQVEPLTFIVAFLEELRFDIWAVASPVLAELSPNDRANYMKVVNDLVKLSSMGAFVKECSINPPVIPIQQHKLSLITTILGNPSTYQDLLVKVKSVFPQVKDE